MSQNKTHPDPYINTCRTFILPPYVSFSTLNYAIQNHRAVYSNLYPYHTYKGKEQDRLPALEKSCSHSVSHKRHWSKLFSNVRTLNVFSKVYAADTENSSLVKAGKDSDVQTTYTGDAAGSEVMSPSSLEALAKAYIAQETGMDRVKMLFHKNHKGDSSPQMMYIKTALVPIALISFFIDYVPAYKFAKSEFIRQHNATSFRTTIEAVRKMSDYASVEAILKGARFSLKVTTFCTSFLLISQIMSSYRNKTSASDFIIASGITGGLARFHMGPKGFVAGSVVGTALGAVYGVIASGLLNLWGITEDVIHLEAVISRLEVERSIVGDSVFKQKIKELTEKAIDMPTASWVRVDLGLVDLGFLLMDGVLT